MRRTRRLFLLAIVVIVGVVGSSYYLQKGLQSRTTPPPPTPLNKGVQASSRDWVYFKADGDRPVVEVRARSMERVEEPAARLLLEGVQLKLYHKDGKEFDLVQSAAAEFNENDGAMFSDGDVEITLGVPEDRDTPPGRLLTIRSSGVRIVSATGHVSTDRHTEFSFDLGDGSATGADYDPQTRELVLHSAVSLHWRGHSAAQPRMDVEAGRLVYREGESKVYLSPWARFRRVNLVLEAGDTVVQLEDGAIRHIQAERAHGRDQYPNRQLSFGARTLEMMLSPKSEVEKIIGAGDARLEAVSASARTEVTTERIDLDFEVSPSGSLLKTALATGKAAIESKPVLRPGERAPANRILKADTILTKMRPGGEELESMETHAPGTLELVPNQPTDPRRFMAADRMWISYGEKNQLRSFRAVQVATRTQKPLGPKMKTEPAPALTWSQDLTADFDTATGELRKLDQWNDFRYQEGARHATAQFATLDVISNLITLRQAARTWDPSGSVNADHILLNQESGEFAAEGNVASTRLADGKPGSAGGGMLAPDEPVQGKARRMTSTDANQLVTYEGEALLWQSANRIQADRITINRKDRSLTAEGNVVSQFLDQQAPPGAGKAVITVVRAPWMRYDDAGRVAHYRGGVRLIREGIDLKSRELRAWLHSENQPGQSSLRQVNADGAVEIFQVEPARTRRGTAGHAEYYVAEERFVLNGGIAQMVDSLKGTTRGRQLTYFSRNDTLLVEGQLTQPVVSRIRRN
jgi:lipopolysaccharide export system protein LptA